MMRAARRPTRRVPISRFLLAFLVAALIFLSASAITRTGETASNSEKQSARGSTSMSWLTAAAPRLASAEIAMFSLWSSLRGFPAAPSPPEPLLVLQASDDIVISQVYGGGGNSGSSYQNDYVELFNQGTSTISLNGWTVNYTSATGNTWQATTLSGSLAPGHYYLVQEAQGTGGTLQLPLPDASGTTQLNSTDGKVALLNGSGCLNGTFDPNGSDCEWDGTVIVDLVGYGSGTTSYEGSGPSVNPSNTAAILRGAGGCIDLNDNKSDFDAGSPNPRNSSSLATQCVTPSPSTTVVISEFRTRGLNGGNDEFVELYNKTSASINIGGWKFKASNNTGVVTTRFTIPANTILPAHRHYLATNNNSSLGYNGPITGDQTYGVGITDNGGLAITLSDDTIVDQAGLSIGSAFKEGRVLDPFTTNTDRSYERKLGGVSGSEQDTDDSRSDFLIRLTSDPQNLQSSPVPDSGPPVATGVKIVHIDVGQGDATLIIGPTRALLFDAGITGSGTVIRNVLNANGITSLDYFVAGHYHADHVGAIDEVILGGITVGTSYDRGGTYSTQAFTEYLAAVGANRSTIALNQQIDLGGGVILTCIAVDGQTNHGTVGSSDENDRSIALVLRYGTFDYLIASDSTGGGSSTANVESFYARDAGDVDVLHVNHHGSNTSTNQTLVNTVRAQQAVISLGNGNSYGHPTQAVLDRLAASAIMDTIWQTEAGTGATSSKVRVGGNITFTSDGTTYSVTNSLNGLNLSYSTDGITGAPLPGPQAVIAGPYSGNAGAGIAFNGAGSTSPGNTITSYQWSFGDNGSATGVAPSHTYNSSGSYTVTLTVTDSAGAMSSAQTTTTINQAPTVSVASPGEGAVFTEPASITITANAGDNDGTVSQVAFYQAATLVGTANSAPFTVTWSGVVQGTYSITAKATDNNGAVTSSAPVNVTVNPPNQPPTVVLTSPTNNAAFSAGSTVTLGANASDTDGTIVKVEFFQGVVKLGEDNTSPYTHSWSNVPSGNYALSARATDNSGAIATSSATNITVNQPPTVTLTSPTNNAVFIAGSTVVLNADAADPDGTINKIEFFHGAIKLSEDTSVPYSYDWANIAAGNYLITARVTDNVGDTTTSAVASFAVLAQVKQYVGWSSISSGIDLGGGSLRKTTTGGDLTATSLQFLLPGDGYFESTAGNYNQSVGLVGSDGAARSLVIGNGGWVGINENGEPVAATSGNAQVPLISPHALGDRYRLEITNSILRYIRYRSGAREIVFTSASPLPAYPLSLVLGISPQNAEWQKTVLAQLTRKATWTSIANGIDLGNGSVRKSSTGGWDFSANAAQTLLRGDGYFESTASYFNHSISLGGADGAGRTLVVGTGGWAAIYENGVEVANTSPMGNITVHAVGDRYRLEIAGGKLRYVRYRSGERAVLFTSTNPIPAYPLSFSLGASFQNSEWQHTVIAQLSQTVTWSYITNGIDLGNGSVRKTSTGAWDFSSGPHQYLVYGNGYFESTASYFNQSISLGGADSLGRALVVGTGGWAAINENGQEVASTSPLNNLTAHVAGDRYRLELGRGKLKYVRYRAGARSLLFASPNAIPTYLLGFNLGASFQNSEWQTTIFSDNVPEHNEAAFVAQTVPSTMIPGQSYSVSVTLRNTGSSTWTPDGDYQLASENLQDNQRWGLSRVNLTTTVLPGSDGVFNFMVTAPTAGSHSFQWRMVEQDVERFGPLTTNVNVQTGSGAPTINLTAPVNNSTFSAGSTVALGADATDADGSITKVEFFQGGIKIGEDETLPYNVNWANVAVGSYVLTARATDNGGAVATSDGVNISVNAANQPPVANAGGPYSAPPNTPIQFNATDSSDSDGVIASYTWNFGDGTTATGPTPSHSYATANNYSVTLSVTDNSGTATPTSVAVAINNPNPSVSSIQIYPGNTTVKAGANVQFAAVSLNVNGAPVGGIEYTWRTNYTGPAANVAISETGDFVSDVPGTFTVIVEGAGRIAQTIVTVQDNSKPSCTGLCAESIPSQDAYGWNKDNYEWANDPIDDRGAPPDRTSVGGALSGNFQQSLPIVSLPGRGPAIDLNLIYNSRVWTKTKDGLISKMTFDIDKDAPAVGWSLGFGKMENLGDEGAFLIDADGTRHGFSGEPRNTDQGGKTFIGHTTDGTFISYICQTNYRGTPGSDYAVAKYPNGIVIQYVGGLEASGARVLYPVSIQDSNGNILNITYYKHSRPENFTRKQIETITDSLGRVVLFHYNSEDLLTAVTAAGIKDDSGNATNRTLIRLNYRQLTLGHTFSPMETLVRGGTTPVWVVNAVYYPANGSGYWFGESDSYSSYGMIRRVQQQKGMGFSELTPLNEQGTITPGNTTLSRTYDYPLTAGQTLTDAPDYQTLTESWEGQNGPPVVTHYDVRKNDSPRTVTVTAPNSTYRKQYSYNFPEGGPGHANDGLVFKDEVYDATNKLLHRTQLGWKQDVAVSSQSAPKPDYIDETDELGQTTRTEFTYGAFNSITEVRERDYNGTLLRKTVREYLNASEYHNDGFGFDHFDTYHPRMVNLVKNEKVFASDGTTLVSHIVLEYDEDPNAWPTSGGSYQGNLKNAPGAVQRNSYFDPYHPFAFVFRSHLARGNVTSITRFSDVNSAASAITEKLRYDITGNLVSRASSSCCEESATGYELATQYAYPVSLTQGSTDINAEVSVSTSATFDFNTGLMLSMKDANGRELTNRYFTNSWRLKQVFSSAGASTDYGYDDIALKTTQTTRTSLSGAITYQTIESVNGIGDVRQEQSLATQGASTTWNTVDTLYDQYGRVWKRSRPYQNEETPKWHETLYDWAGREVGLRDAAGDGPTTAYNEITRPAGASTEPGQTTKAIDAWGRWRWSRLDSSGRLAEVVEPNPAGGDGFVTRYFYDTGGNLVRVEQGDRIRRFRYDSLGRLTHQKLAEATATLNSAGNKATNEPESERWSDVFTYDQHSNMLSRTDARGVKTLLNYSDGSGNHDPLNRLQSMSYDTAMVDTSLTVLPAATVSYQYRTRSASQAIDLTQVKQIRASGITTEDYDYDAEGRPRDKTLKLDSLSKPMTVSYAYDTLNRLSQTTYPEQYIDDLPSPVRKVATPSYDAGNRVDSLKVNDINYASQIQYDAGSKITQLVVGVGPNQLIEKYTYNPVNGWLVNQTVKRGQTTLMDLTYDYKSQYCLGENCPTITYPQTGQMTRMDDQNGSKFYSYDPLGRLSRVEAGTVAKITNNFSLQWSQDYSYDRFGNRTSSTASGNAGGSPVPLDGVGTLSYDSANRITTSGYSYDAAGNQLQNGTGQSLVYDAAGRLVKVKDQNNSTVATYTYGASNLRLATQNGNESSTARTYYVWDSATVISEYVTASITPTAPQWSKNYFYFGGELIATEEPAGISGERVDYHHPDRLGTRLVTNNSDTTSIEQVTLPFGTALNSQSSGATNRRFTSYDRSATTGLDYAMNRSYDSRQGRFTQADPIGMESVNLSNPQSLNLYSYSGNDPINSVDPTGTTDYGIFFGGFPGGQTGRPNGNGSLGGLFNFFGGLLGTIFNPGRSGISHPGFRGPLASMPIGGIPGTPIVIVTKSFQNPPKKPVYREWVVKNRYTLERKIWKQNWEGYIDRRRECAALPMMWDYKGHNQPIWPRQTPQWRMGRKPQWGDNTTEGTVFATFDRSQRKYLNKPQNNHTLIFNSWYQNPVTREKGMWVMEQGPYFAPRLRIILFNDLNDYFNNANFYNVVQICPACVEPPKKPR